MAGVSAAGQRVSFADMEHWPDDGRRYELYDDGVLVPASTTSGHQSVRSPPFPALEVTPADLVPTF